MPKTTATPSTSAIHGTTAMRGMGKVPFNLHTALTAWQWSPFSVAVLVALVGAAYWYLKADWRLAARGRRWRGSRTLSFLSGLVAVDIALGSPVATFTGDYFQAHVTQHLLLMVVAPPLLALGAPSTLLMQSSGRRVKKLWLGVLKSKPFAVLTHPVVVWFLYFGAMFAFFLTPLVNYAMEHMALMDGLNIVFLLGGCFYWWPTLGVDPIVHWRMGYGARIANLAIGVPFESFLGVAIMSDRSSVASMYSLSSTHAGGALLWAATELATFVGLAPVFLQWVRSEDRAGARADTRADALGTRGLRVATVGGSSPAAGTPAAPAGAERGGSSSQIAQQFRPLLQPGNSTWEAMWRAKAGYVPSSARKPQGPGAGPSAGAHKDGA